MDEKNQPTVENLLKRANDFLEDGEWDKAEEYADRILDINQEEPQAYLIKLMAKKRTHNMEDLASGYEPLMNSRDFQKAEKYADEKLKEKLAALNQKTLEANKKRTVEQHQKKQLRKKISGIFILLFLFIAAGLAIYHALVVVPAVKAKEERYRLSKIPGSTVRFGHYEQDNNLKNGMEEIEWLVLAYDKKNEKSLLVSVYGLDYLPYNNTDEDCTWETCSLRKWLNHDFLNSAFSPEEQKSILFSRVLNDSSQGSEYWHEESNSTTDKIFLLSMAEASRYFKASHTNSESGVKSARIAPTAYAIEVSGGWKPNKETLTKSGEYASEWWLRNLGGTDGFAVFIQRHGVFAGVRTQASNFVRPALWLSLR